MGMKAKLHRAMKTNHALENGTYHQSPVTIQRALRFGRVPSKPTPVSNGVWRMAAVIQARRNSHIQRGV
jgi:hypothetical protein